MFEPDNQKLVNIQLSTFRQHFKYIYCGLTLFSSKLERFPQRISNWVDLLLLSNQTRDDIKQT